MLCLCEAEKLLKVEMKRAASVEVVGDLLPIHLDLVERCEALILHAVEVGVVAVALCGKSCLSVPFGILDAEVLRWDELGVEAYAVLLQGFLILCLKYGEQLGKKLFVSCLVVDVIPEIFCRLHNTVQSDGEELFVDVHVASCVSGEQSSFDIILIHHTGGYEIKVHISNHRLKGIEGKSCNVPMHDILLHEAVHVDGDNLCTSCDDAARAEGVTKGVVSKLVAKAAAGGKAVHAVTHIDKKAVSLAHLLCTVVAELRVGKAILCGKEARCENWKGE